jgi:hypothetical protein
VVQQAGAAGLGKELGADAEEAACRDLELDAGRGAEEDRGGKFVISYGGGTPRANLRETRSPRLQPGDPKAAPICEARFSGRQKMGAYNVSRCKPAFLSRAEACSGN